MLRINRLRVEINTAEGLCGIDTSFTEKLNFIASNHNTCGKSSILAAIYYCLGFEQILGGVGGIGSKVLTSVFKTAIEGKKETCKVTESGAYLEISNGNETRTIYRNIKSESKDNRLITVFFGDYDSISDPKTISADYYVNIQNAATSEKGFHAFLEDFLHLELPLVRASDGNDRKLYLQLVFSAMFIEQKHGWSDILSGMPVFGIRESKKRIIEYILGLDTFKNEKEKERLNELKYQLERKWKELIADFEKAVHLEFCEITNLPVQPRVLHENDCSRIHVLVSGVSSIEEEVNKLRGEYDSLRQMKPKVCDNFEALSNELSETQEQIIVFENRLGELDKNLASYNTTIKRLKENLELLNSDIRNNTDAARLQKFGSEASDMEISAMICPICKQKIQDNLLDSVATTGYMSIEENIRHLKEQKKMIEFTLGYRVEAYEESEREKQDVEARLQTLRRLAQTLRSDLNTTIDEDVSEAIMLKKIQLSERIERLGKLSNCFDAFMHELKNLSVEWSSYLDKKNRLPKKEISDQDNEKIVLLKQRFVENLKQYHYSSTTGFDDIDISMDTSLLPTIDGFDMKFDSSASDGIRVIWAYTMALLQVSLEKDGNHPGIIIFDEPAQQSIVPEDMKSFIDSVVAIKEPFQIITAITLNSQELNNIVNNLGNTDHHRIQIEGKAFNAFVK